jgi:hypothetical protein
MPNPLFCSLDRMLGVYSFIYFNTCTYLCYTYRSLEQFLENVCIVASCWMNFIRTFALGADYCK